MTLSLQCSDEKKKRQRQFISFLRSPCYKLQSFAYLTLHYLLSHFMLFLVSLLSVIIADLVMFKGAFPSSHHIYLLASMNTLCPDVASSCVIVSVSC